MPIYEYQCGKCGHEFEREQRMSDDPIKTCPECRSRKVKKLISQTSFVLKGGGWYSDLYSSAKDTKPSDSDSSSSKNDSSTSGDSDKKSEAKPKDKKSGAKGGADSKGGKGDKKSAA